MKRDMHQVCDEIFQNTPAIDAKITVGNRNRRNLNNELIRKRPRKPLLRNTITQRKPLTATQQLLSNVSTTFIFLYYVSYSIGHLKRSNKQ